MFKTLFGKNRLARLATLAAVISLSAMSSAQLATANPAWDQMLDTKATRLGIDGNLTSTLTMLDKPSTVNFKWTTKIGGAVGGKWAVTDGPTGQPLKTGIITPAPALGQQGSFSIDFTKIASPHATSIVKHYYVRVSPINAQNQPLGMPSESVDILYVKSPE